MPKGIKYTLIGLLIIVGAGFLVLTFTIDSIVSSNIEQIGSEMTGTPVTVENVSISPFSGSGTIQGFRIANPDGYSQDHAVTIEDFSIELELFTLFSDEIIVNEIIISGASVYVEQKLPENNIREIMSHVNSVEEGEASDARLIIEHFVLENGTADLYTEVGGERSARVEISRIELNDLGRASGQQTAEAVIKQIAKEVAGESLEAAAGSGVEQLQDAIRDLFN
ncbi:DUF748 domain-containing protein [Rhodohalobacter sp. 8-1]|uniref:DUF748 domain-containing protein n=1 Tax=Rhodohalobacter sp. 8-1 TaxID=3131972 RepID=UPI0030ED29BA